MEVIFFWFFASFLGIQLMTRFGSCGYWFWSKCVHLFFRGFSLQLYAFWVILFDHNPCLESPSLGVLFWIDPFHQLWLMLQF